MQITRKSGANGKWRDVGATDAIIGICLVMAVAGFVIPPVQNALLFYPPLALHQPWRLVTSAFLHSGLWHFVFNMVTLYMVGVHLERAMGRGRYLLLYLASAVAGNLGVWGWAALTGGWQVAVVGASGAVFGLFGAWLARAGFGSDNFKSIAVIAAVNLGYGLLNPGISWQSHMAGFIGGYLVTWFGQKLGKLKHR